ncbi:MAG: hypothetical protein NVSMB52_17140 [Chloroflexota bacterium]
MHDVVLDENVYIRALESECTGLAEDHRASRVVQLVQDRHRWVFTHGVLTAYRRQFNAISCKGSMATRLIVSLKDVFVDERCFLFIDTVDIVPGRYDPQDQHVVAAAAHGPNSYLVTLDMRLRNALESADIPKTYGFHVVDLETAEALLQG